MRHAIYVDGAESLNSAAFHDRADRSPHIVWVAAGDGRLLFVNRAGVRWLGLTREASLGHGWLQAIIPDQREPLTWMIRSAYRRPETRVFPLAVINPGGVHRWTFHVGIPVFSSEDGIYLAHLGGLGVGPPKSFKEMAALLTALLDVRVRRLLPVPSSTSSSPPALRQKVIVASRVVDLLARWSSDMTQQRILSHDVPLMLLDRNLRVTAWNWSMEEMTSVPADVVLGRPVLDCFPFMEQNGTIPGIERTLRGKTTHGVHLSIPQPSLTLITAFTRRPVFAATGKVSGLVTACEWYRQLHWTQEDIERFIHWGKQAGACALMFMAL